MNSDHFNEQEFSEDEIMEAMRNQSRRSSLTYRGKRISFWGELSQRVPFGQEVGHARFEWDIAAGQCQHCNCRIGECHQPRCHAEQCSRCNQLLLLQCLCGKRVRAIVTLRARRKAEMTRESNRIIAERLRRSGSIEPTNIFED